MRKLFLWLLLTYPFATLLAMRICFVHDYLNQYGGAERVLQVLCDMFPDAPIYTLLYDERATGGVFRGREIHTSFLQRVPFVRSHHRLFPMLMPLAVEQFNLAYFDVVLSVSASFAKGIITKPSTRHINYCLTPARFLWDDSQRYVQEFRYPKPLAWLAAPFITYLRVWDQEAALRVDEFVGISQFVRKRIQKYYGADSVLIYPPVATQRFYISDTLDDYFLMVGRLVPYKRFDVAIQAFSAMGLPLKIVGDGPDRRRLQKLAGVNIEFLGLVSDDRLPELYARAQALIFPQEEDFGIVPLEAMAAGRPVIAYRAGGALETVSEGISGVFFDEQTEIAIAQAVGTFHQTTFDPKTIRAHSMRFDEAIFRREFYNLLHQRSLGL